MNKWFRINYSLYVGVVLVTFLLFIAVFGSFMAPHTLTETLDTTYVDGDILAPPLEPNKSDRYPLGTDRWGYDILTMVLHGIRYTIFIALAVTLIKMVFGTIIGFYVGTWKKTPSWMESIENAWSYVPLFLILYFFFNPIIFNSPIGSYKLILYFILLTSIISIPSIVSSTRKKTSETYKSVFIEAARALGASRHRLIWKHIFPQMKESLLVMFILEIVYVITIMGQLALMNIFVGGTIVRQDPVIYLSITKEISGLVGSARGNIYGSQYILQIPLVILLFITISFSLLANGLKNRYQSNYQRTPWIKTGFEPKLMPKRKEYLKKTRWWTPNGTKTTALIIIVLFFGAGAFVYLTKDNDVGVKNYSKADYHLNVKMDNEGDFQSKAEIKVTNHSNKTWDELIFYFIPNEFKKGHSFKSVKGFSEIDMKDITVDGKKVTYSLDQDTLKINLNNKMDKRDKVDVVISYRYTLPEEGDRFSKVNGNYYLAQWYPMLATFQKGKWNKEPYSEGLETYHTDFSNYEVEYDIPKGYSLVSTADHDADLKASHGKLKIKKVRDFFIAIVKDMKMYKTSVNGVDIRLFSKDDHDKNPEEALKLAKKALGFYQEKIGEYPHKQLDIILDKGYNMEYPGIVTIDPYQDNEGFFKISIVHEIAHQYFYGVVSNDPYHEAWIDEGITEFATNMYFYLGEKQGRTESQLLSLNRMKSIEEQGLKRQYSNVPLDKNKHTGYIYGQPALRLFELVEDKDYVREKDFDIVLMEYLSDYYHHFQYKEVNTSEFIRFTKDYFQVPKGSFNEWLDTSEVNF
ncbi:ABC transporter permease subunit [Neobacillus sp. D3-1R]|uniref:ABC transporter permease subunit n=1 Tax=Neobacillus sp. D3-1R TaxID=3445778 RepID=UPI003FA014CE